MNLTLGALEVNPRAPDVPRAVDTADFEARDSVDR